MQIQTINPEGARRILVTRMLPGDRWKELLRSEGFRVDVVTEDRVFDPSELAALVGDDCYGVIGQLSEAWDRDLMLLLARAGGRVFSNYAVGYNNIDTSVAASHGMVVCNTPGVLTETTAEMGVALTFAAARRIAEGDKFMREGKFHGWLPKLFRGNLLWRKTLGLVGAGRIGSTYARMMIMGHQMDCVYYSPSPKTQFEETVRRFYAFTGNTGASIRRVTNLEELLTEADVIALFPTLNPSTVRMINKERLALCKPNAILVNMSRGQVVDEHALVAHLRENPRFLCGLDVYQHEPSLEPGLAELPNVVLAPHAGSASYEARENMATLCALNILGVARGYPHYPGMDMAPFLSEAPPHYIPSVVAGHTK